MKIRKSRDTPKTAASERSRWHMTPGRAMEVLGPVVRPPGVDRPLTDEEIEAIRVLGRAVTLHIWEETDENNAIADAPQRN